MRLRPLSPAGGATSADKNDPSDATLTVIEEQHANRDPLTTEELLLSKRVETNESGTLDAWSRIFANACQVCKKNFLVVSSAKSHDRAIVAL